MKIKKILSIALTVAVLCSCSKNETNFEADVLNPPMLKTINVLPDMLTFDTYEDYEETRDYVNSLSDDEREVWFESHTEYVSFGRERDHMYDFIIEEYDVEGRDAEGLRILFDDYGKYLTLYSEVINGEENYFVGKCEEADGNDDYYIMNENRVYAIGDSVYKWYDTTLLIVPTSFYQTLRSSSTVDEAEEAAANLGVSIQKCFREGPRGRDGVHYVGLAGTIVPEGGKSYQIRIELFPRFRKHGMVDQYIVAKVSNKRRNVNGRTWVLCSLNTQIDHARVKVTPNQMLAQFSPDTIKEIFRDGYSGRIKSKKFKKWITSFPSDGFGYFSPNRFDVSLTGWNVYATNSKGSEINEVHNIQ